MNFEEKTLKKRSLKRVKNSIFLLRLYRNELLFALHNLNISVTKMGQVCSNILLRVNPFRFSLLAYIIVEYRRVQ